MLLTSFIALALFCIDVSAQEASCPDTPTPWPSASSFPSMQTLPDPFTYLNGNDRVNTTSEWYACRKPELLQVLQKYQYGFYPNHSSETVSATLQSTNLLVTVTTANGKSATITAALSLPASASAAAPVPVIIATGGIDNNAYLQANLAVATFDYNAIASDSSAASGAFWTLYPGADIGTLLAWAWAYHRIIDGLALAVPAVNTSAVGVTGCSRLGKAAVAAGVFDERVALTMAMSSGVSGLGPYRYHGLSGQDETLENSKAGAPWWTDDELGDFVGQSERTPWDAHEVAVAIAPRALVIDQGTGDPYTDSKGTAIVTFEAARKVFEWLGVGDQIGMAVRSGGHCDFSGYTNVLPFVLKVLKGTPTTRDFTDVSPWTPMTEAYPWASDLP